MFWTIRENRLPVVSKVLEVAKFAVVVAPSSKWEKIVTYPPVYLCTLHSSQLPICQKRKYILWTKKKWFFFLCWDWDPATWDKLSQREGEARARALHQNQNHSGKRARTPNMFSKLFSLPYQCWSSEVLQDNRTNFCFSCAWTYVLRTFR